MRQRDAANSLFTHFNPEQERLYVLALTRQRSCGQPLCTQLVLPISLALLLEQPRLASRVPGLLSAL